MTKNKNDRTEYPTMQPKLQLLEYEGYKRLTNVMETLTPLHGKCNFPTIDVTPRDLVQRVRTKLNEERIKVKDIRLNGSAATHVLSQEDGHSYKDLDLIFTVDLSAYVQDETPSKNYSRHSSYNGPKSTRPKRQRSASENTSSKEKKERPVDLKLSERMGEYLLQRDNENQELDIGSPKIVLDDDTDDVTDSGYTSSGSSVSSYPVSPTANWSFQSSLRNRTHSLESTSSIASASSSGNGSFTRKSVRVTSKGENISRKPSYNSTIRSNKEECWKRIKNVVITILTELLPSEMRGNADAVSDAYVQKMVKVNNEEDTWSLFSLNNNTGKNLELKFVENMQRQYEFSVDSFQIILDSYIGFKMVNRNSDIDLNTNFYPSILAESVYGDFEAALRHLNHKRICTHRPEEIRGGGLLRYCNLLARDYTPGEVPAFKKMQNSNHNCQSKFNFQRRHDEGFNSSSAKDVERLEQLMCSRFFIDFSDFQIQQKKLSSYLDNHFVNEDDLKFNYLLTLRRVVDQNTICLMMHERSLIINYITNLARQTLASNIGSSRVKVSTETPVYLPQYIPQSTQGYFETTQSNAEYYTVPQTDVDQYSPYPSATNTVHSYTKPVCTTDPGNGSQAQQPTPYYPPQQVYPQCTGVATCTHCGSKDVYLDTNNNCSENLNTNNNNNYGDFNQPQCYNYPPPPVYVYYQDSYGSGPQYAYPNSTASTSTSYPYSNEAPMCPIVYCSPATQCFFTPSSGAMTSNPCQ